MMGITLRSHYTKLLDILFGIFNRFFSSGRSSSRVGKKCLLRDSVAVKVKMTPLP